MCRITLLSTPISSQTCAVKSSGSRRKSPISRAASSTQSGRTSATSRVSLSPRLSPRKTKNCWPIGAICFGLVAAEVQAHSSQQSRAERDQLREQLLEAFRRQMEIRRSLLELESSSMEIQIDTSKQLLTIAELVF